MDLVIGCIYSNGLLYIDRCRVKDGLSCKTIDMIVEDLVMGEGHIELVCIEIIAGNDDATRAYGVDIAALYGAIGAPGNIHPVARTIADMGAVDLYIIAIHKLIAIAAAAADVKVDELHIADSGCLDPWQLGVAGAGDGTRSRYPHIKHFGSEIDAPLCFCSDLFDEIQRIIRLLSRYDPAIGLGADAAIDTYRLGDKTVRNGDRLGFYNVHLELGLPVAAKEKSAVCDGFHPVFRPVIAVFEDASRCRTISPWVDDLLHRHC